MLTIAGIDLNMLPNATNYKRTYVQMGQQRRTIYYTLSTSHPGVIIRWNLKFYLGEEPIEYLSDFVQGNPVTFVDQDDEEYQVKILDFTHDGYFVPVLSEVNMMIETVSPIFE